MGDTVLMVVCGTPDSSCDASSEEDSVPLAALVNDVNALVNETQLSPKWDDLADLIIGLEDTEDMAKILFHLHNEILDKLSTKEWGVEGLVKIRQQIIRFMRFEELHKFDESKVYVWRNLEVLFHELAIDREFPASNNQIPEWVEGAAFMAECIHSDSNDLKDLALSEARYDEPARPVIFGKDQKMYSSYLTEFLLRCLSDADIKMQYRGVLLARSHLKWEQDEDRYSWISEEFARLTPKVIEICVVSAKKNEFEPQERKTSDDYEDNDAEFELLLLLADCCRGSMKGHLDELSFWTLTGFCMRYRHDKKIFLVPALCGEAPHLVSDRRVPFSRRGINEIVRHCLFDSTHKDYHETIPITLGYEDCSDNPCSFLISGLGIERVLPLALSMILEALPIVYNVEEWLSAVHSALFEAHMEDTEIEDDVIVKIVQSTAYLLDDQSHRMSACHKLRYIFTHWNFPLTDQSHQEIMTKLKDVISLRRKETGGTTDDYTLESAREALAAVEKWPNPDSTLSTSDADEGSTSLENDSSSAERSPHVVSTSVVSSGETTSRSSRPSLLSTPTSTQIYECIRVARDDQGGARLRTKAVKDICELLHNETPGACVPVAHEFLQKEGLDLLEWCLVNTNDEKFRHQCIGAAAKIADGCLYCRAELRESNLLVVFANQIADMREESVRCTIGVIDNALWTTHSHASFMLPWATPPALLSGISRTMVRFESDDFIVESSLRILIALEFPCGELLKQDGLLSCIVKAMDRAINSSTASTALKLVQHMMKKGTGDHKKHIAMSDSFLEIVGRHLNSADEKDRKVVLNVLLIGFSRGDLSPQIFDRMITDKDNIVPSLLRVLREDEGYESGWVLSIFEQMMLSLASAPRPAMMDKLHGYGFFTTLVPYGYRKWRHMKEVEPLKALLTTYPKYWKDFKESIPSGKTPLLPIPAEYDK